MRKHRRSASLFSKISNAEISHICGLGEMSETQIIAPTASSEMMLHVNSYPSTALGLSLALMKVMHERAQNQTDDKSESFCTLKTDETSESNVYFHVFGGT